MDHPDTGDRMSAVTGCTKPRQVNPRKGKGVIVHHPYSTASCPFGFTRVFVDANRTYLPENTDFGGQPFFEWIEEHQDIRLHKLSQDISAIALTASEGIALGEEAGRPALRIIRRYFGAQQRDSIISITTHRSEDFVYSLRIDIEE